MMFSTPPSLSTEERTDSADIFPIARLPQEILGEVFLRLPSASFMGENDVRLVCHSWKKVIEKTRLPQKKTKAAVLEQCKSETDALGILRDSILRASLSFKETLKVASRLPAARNAALACAAQQSQDKLFDPSDYVEYQLSKENPAHAMELFRKNSLPAGTQLKLASKHKELAEEYSKGIEITPFNAVLCKQASILESVLRNPETIKALDNRLMDEDLIDLELALKIINTPDLLNHFSKGGNHIVPSLIAKICSNHEQAAHRLIDIWGLSSSTHLASLVHLASKYLSVAQRVLNSDLWNSLSIKHRTQIAHNHLTLAISLYDLPEYHEPTEGLPHLPVCLFAESNAQILVKVLLNKKIMEAIRTHNAFLAEKFKVIAKGLKLPGIIQLIRKNVTLHEIQYELFKLGLADRNQDVFVQMVPPSDLMEYAKQSIDIGLQILARPDLSVRLTGYSLYKLCIHSVFYANEILSNPNLKEQIKDAYLIDIALKYPHVGRVIRELYLVIRNLDIFPIPEEQIALQELLADRLNVDNAISAAVRQHINPTRNSANVKKRKLADLAEETYPSKRPRIK